MTRCFLFLLFIVIFGISTNQQVEVTSIISQYNHHDNSGGEIKPSQILVVSFGIIEGNYLIANPFTTGKKQLHADGFYLSKHYRSNYTTSDINLLTLIRKDIHFLSVLLI